MLRDKHAPARTAARDAWHAMDVSAVPLAVVPLKAEGNAPLLARDGSALTGAAAAAEAADIAAALEAEQQDAELVPLFPDFPPAARAKLRAFGKATWRALTDFTLFFSVFLIWHLVHQARGACPTRTAQS